MKFKINAKKLADALGLICLSVELGKKGALQILSHVLMRVDKKQLFMAVTDVDITATIVVPIEEVTKPGEGTALASDLLALAVACKNNTLEFSKGDKPGWIFISQAETETEFKVASLDPRKFPGIQEPIAGGKIIPAQIISLLVQQTIYALGGEKDEVRSNLQVNLSKGLVQAVATDGGRVSVVDAEISVLGKPTTLHIPKRAAVTLGAIAATVSEEGDQGISLAIDGNLLYFSFGDLKLFCRQPTVDFPKWGNVLKGIDNYCILTAQGREFADAVMMVNTLKDRELILDITPDKFSLYESNENGERRARVSVTSTNPDFEKQIKLSPAFVTNFLASMTKLSKEFSIEIVIPSAYTPIVFKVISEHIKMTYMMAARIDPKQQNAK